MNKVSVIVPIYKVEKYLDRCIQSIVNQTYKNIEIILVDDGSPDNCPKICDDWAKKDSRIVVIHKKNGGVSSARNLGLERATGDYITFADADDFIDETMYEKLVDSAVQKESDVVLCRFSYFYEETEKENKIMEVNLDKLSKEKIFPFLLKVGMYARNDSLETENIMGCIWRGIYKKDIIKNVRFQNLSICEDTIFIIDVFKRNPKISIVNDYLYRYVQRKTSAVHQFNETKINNRINAYKVICEKLCNLVSKEELQAYKFHIYASIINELLKNGQKKEIANITRNEFLKDLNTKDNYKFAMKSTRSRRFKLAYWLVRRKMFGVYSILLRLI